MRQVIKRIFTLTLLTTFILFSGIVTLILYPQPLFANKLEFGRFRVYSPTAINKDIKTILANALSLVEKSELHDPNYRYDIFISHHSFYNKLDDVVLGNKSSARATDNNVVIKASMDVGQNLAFPTFYQLCKTDLTILIAHEMVHCLQENKYGKLKFNPFWPVEMWKLEGYPEYISRQGQRNNRNYSLIAEIDRYQELKKSDYWIPIVDNGCKSPEFYYKSRLMTEYLMDIKLMTYDKILADTTSENILYEELLTWKDQTQNRKGGQQ